MRLILAAVVLLVGSLSAQAGRTPVSYSSLYGPEQSTQRTVFFRTCAANKLEAADPTDPNQISRVCILSVEPLNESIHDFQIFQVIYRSGESVTYSLLPFTIDALESRNQKKNVLKARIVILSEAQTTGQTINEGTVYLVYQRNGSHGQGSPVIVGRTPRDEPFLAKKTPSPN